MYQISTFQNENDTESEPKEDDIQDQHLVTAQPSSNIRGNLMREIMDFKKTQLKNVKDNKKGQTKSEVILKQR